MKLRLAAIAIALFALLPTTASAQAVQLPTFRSFGVSTTVSVPDRGGAFLGGVGGASSGRVSRGMPLGIPGRAVQNTAIGSSRSAGGVQVRAFIHDHEAMDRALLQQADARQAAARPPVAAAAGVAEVRENQARQALSKQEEAEDFLRRAKAAEAAGKPQLAKIYQRMAESRTAKLPAVGAADGLAGR